MAGPSVSVLIDEELPPSWREAIGERASLWNSPTSCYVSDLKSFSLTYSGEPRPFVGSVDAMHIENDPYLDRIAETEALEQCSGRSWTHAIVLAAMCNQKVDHLVLAELSISIATEFNGLIDLDCLVAPADFDMFLKCRWECEGEEFWTTLGTPDAVQNWIHHPTFRMVK